VIDKVMKYYAEEAKRFKENLSEVLKEYDQQNSLNMCNLSRDLTIEFMKEPGVLSHIARVSVLSGMKRYGPAVGFPNFCHYPITGPTLASEF
jgi:hypothetical protein